MNESDIRDLLVDQLDCLEPNLRYLEKEQYIPGAIATRSFIDILARDSADHLVIIELKRSDSAAREAIHEVLKYVEAVKSHLAVRDDEIRTMIVSTEWTELLLPFSRFCSDTTLDVTGLLLDASDPSRLASETVSPLPITAGRAFSEWHELNLYTDTANLQRGVETYERSNEIKGLHDYVLVILEPPASHHELEQSVTRVALADIQSRSGEEPNYDDIEATVQALPQFKHMIYFVPCLLPKEAYIDALKRLDGDDADEVIEYAEEIEESEALCMLHEAFFDVKPRPFRELIEIGYAAKFKTKLLDDEGWSITEIKRYGSIARSPLLTDETIVSEICGDTGSSHQHYKRRISTAVKSELATARSEIAECLSDNPAWKANILAHLQEIENDYPGTDLEVYVFSPSTGLFTLYLALTNQPSDQYIPSYYIKFRRDRNGETIFFGLLEVNATEVTFREVVDRFYDGNVGKLAFSATWGCREPRDAEVLDFVGISYASYRCDTQGDERRFHVWRNSTWQEIKTGPSPTPLASFFEREHTFVHHLASKIGRRLSIGMVDGSDTEIPLRELADLSTRDGTRHKASELPSECDRCGCAFAEENFLVEASLPDFGDATASICADCVEDTDATVDQSDGRLYRRVDPDTWERVRFDGPNAPD